ncbi:MAG TPA: serine/threonine-protein kinase [Nocardioides sp.]|nr:serine/threonine-protein kinase [Nocardioides sp.]
MSLPERLGRLQRIDRIGVGGFATVWLYRDDELDSLVAVKALADNWAVRHDIRERFLEEARILRRADSDHVVRVYDIGEADGTPYFVMSYADRGSMAMLLDPAHPLPPEQVADLIAQAGEGVSVLHRNGVIHRDIKPQNLLLRSTPEGGTRVLVADLGVAKAVVHASGLTQVVGTPAYMAPEQATGLGIDKRADVHALAAVAYVLLTGQLVRKGGLSGVGGWTLPPPPSRLVRVAPEWDTALLRALEPEPERRWPDVESFVAAVRAAGARPAPEPAPETVAVLQGPAPRPVAQPQRPVGAREEARTLVTPEPFPAPVQHQQRRPRRVLAAVLFLVVLLATFAGSYLLTTMLR